MLEVGAVFSPNGGYHIPILTPRVSGAARATMSQEINGELVPVGGGDSIPLIREKLSVGRRESCDIPLRFPNISGLHCELTFRNGYWYIRDLNSTNGVKVNGARVKDKLLHPKDEVTIGKRQYTINYELPAGRTAQEEVEEDIMSQSLLQKAGLERPPDARKDAKGRRVIDPVEFLLRDDDD
jgi:FHA domain